ncbi:hypothetical protein V2J09_014526 [Rumex salicifolius]
MANNVNPSLVPEIGPDGLPKEAPIIAYTEKIIAAEQLQLRKYIEENYSKIRDVERELAGLSLELKLTAGSKNAAFEHMRKKIEVQTEKIRVAKLKEEQTRKVWEAALKAVEDEEAIKKKLCDDLNNLVQESNNSQYARLEELKRRLEAMNPARASVSTPPDTNEPASTPSTTEILPTNQASSANVNPVANGTNDPLVMEEKGKKKMMQGRGKGIGALPKGRNPLTPGGWTGSGFNVDS